MSERELFKLLRELFPKNEYALLSQVGNATGWGTSRHCDALCLGLWPSRGIHLHGFEVKCSRTDWMKELKSPEKAEEIAKYCNHWWIVVGPGDIIRDGELPTGWGLIKYDESKKKLLKSVLAPFREATPITVNFVAAILRRAQEEITDEAQLNERFREGIEEGRIIEKDHRHREMRKLAEIEKTVTDFRKASGIDLCGWEGGKKIGEAVRMVLDGDIMRYRSQLRALAERVVQELQEPQQ